MEIELESSSGSRVVTFCGGMLAIEDKYDGSVRSALLDRKTAEELAVAILKWVKKS